MFHALSSILSSSDSIFQLDLSDCLLTSESTQVLLEVKYQHLFLYQLYQLSKGLARNSSIKILLLKGNNISGNTVVLLGRLLRLNSSITRLSLEWNCVGLDHDCFAGLCAGLASNQSLQVLDLRNNQLSHQAVVALCSALRANSTVRHLGEQNFIQLK